MHLGMDFGAVNIFEMTNELINKLDAARRLIQLAAEAAEKEGGRLEVTYSGGKDSDSSSSSPSSRR